MMTQPSTEARPQIIRPFLYIKTVKSWVERWVGILDPTAFARLLASRVPSKAPTLAVDPTQDCNSKLTGSSADSLIFESYLAMLQAQLKL